MKLVDVQARGEQNEASQEQEQEQGEQADRERQHPLFKDQPPSPSDKAKTVSAERCYPFEAKVQLSNTRPSQQQNQNENWNTGMRTAKQLLPKQNSNCRAQARLWPPVNFCTAFLGGTSHLLAVCFGECAIIWLSRSMGQSQYKVIRPLSMVPQPISPPWPAVCWPNSPCLFFL